VPGFAVRLKMGFGEVPEIPGIRTACAGRVPRIARNTTVNPRKILARLPNKSFMSFLLQITLWGKVVMG
jgi:hypothetical protein